ncbi:tRNA pseudouridine synthase A [Robiginitalea sediminis]|uniref:tRNA pseudouridine(38-40) synthase TruA n=1 Tax=Robiginitalea sediminis TaxID=1982593 RepID=UPI000B4A8BCA|nr:tRNA pseudouridine(38-40) synthase TruA [Robiginitalea sediminis]
MDPPPLHYYVMRIQFLGFRYHGWQHQPGVQTVEGMLRKTVRFILPGRTFRILGAGRTDARVSSEDFALQLMIKDGPEPDLDLLREDLTKNLPPDIRLVEIYPVAQSFNVIRDCRQKTYRYLFAYGAPCHPYCSPFLGFFREELDLVSMQEAAPLFEGTHCFEAFTAGEANAKRKLTRTVEKSRILPNTFIKASFMPPKTYAFEITASGFGRHQVRLMMAALVDVGRGVIGREVLSGVLEGKSDWKPTHITPASGLHLCETRFDPITKNPKL